MTIRTLTATPDQLTHRGFLLAEDQALKTYLTGIQVPGRPARDGTAGDPVDVGAWFRWPVGDRQIKYPFITIDLLTVEPAFELFHSNHWQSTDHLYQPSVSPTLTAPALGWGVQDYSVLNYLPFKLVYQVAHYARSHQHDRYLTSIFMTDVFPVRPFWIGCDADNTWRRTEMLGYTAADTPETTESGTKRIFRKMYTVSMMAEIPQQRLIDATQYKALRALISVADLAEFDRYHEAIMEGHADPIGEFTDAQRVAEGEYGYIAHQGHQVPTPPV